MTSSDGLELKIGVWFTGCCHKELFQIRNLGDLEFAESLANESSCEWWGTQRDALESIRASFLRGGCMDFASEIEELLEKINEEEQTPEK